LASASSAAAFAMPFSAVRSSSSARPRRSRARAAPSRAVHGPGQALDNPYQGVLGIFLGNIMRGEPITIFGDGEQTRDFVYIGDIVEGWVRALSSPATAGQAINLGSGRSLTINQLAEAAIRACGGDGRIIRAPARPGEQRSVQADVSKARALMGWEPRTPFETGLKETLRWAKQEVAATPAARGWRSAAR